jgi:nucleotidyltransferase substrate binding protein (TIGR01987 family)
MNKIQIINQVKSIILKYSNPERIWLFGSTLREDVVQGSDLDIAYWDENANNESNQSINNEIDQLNTLVKIDVKNISKADERFANRVKSTGKVLYSATKKLKVEDSLFNLSKALDKLQLTVKTKERYIEDGYEDVYLEVLIKRFEFTYELMWKSLKRYLDFEGLEARSPRSVFKKAYELGLLKEEEIWLDMMETRNLTTHIYDEWQMKELASKIARFASVMSDVRDEMENRM